MKKTWLLVVGAFVAACSAGAREGGERVGAAAEAASIPDPPCPGNRTEMTLTSGDDVRFFPDSELCVRGLEGRDVISISGQRPLVISGDGDDVVTITSTSPFVGVGGVVFAGAGNDVIYPLDGYNEVRAGDGDDVIIAPGGHTIAVPGPGRDYVSLGPEGDSVGIYDPCDVEPGEIIDAGDGVDTLYTTVPVEALEARGITLVGFERLSIVVNGKKSACAMIEPIDASVPDSGATSGPGGGVPGCDTCFPGNFVPFPAHVILNPVLAP